MIIEKNKNTITAYGGIYYFDGLNFSQILESVMREYSRAEIHLHTGGGSVFEGNLMYNALNKYNEKITLIVDGIAASMGAMLLTSVQDVQIVSNGYVMIHAPSSFSDGTASEKEEEAKLLRSMEQQFLRDLTNKTKKSLEEVKEWLNGDTWFNATEAKEVGLVSGIIPPVSVVPIEDNPKDIGLEKAMMAYSSLLAKAKNIKEPNQIIKKVKMRQDLIALLIQSLVIEGISIDSSDTAVVEAVEKKIKEEKEAREKIEKKMETATENSINTILDSSEVKTLIGEDRAVYAEIGKNSGIESLKKVISQLKKKRPPSIGSFIESSQTGEDTDQWTFDDWQVKNPKGLEMMATNDEEKFKELFNQKYNR